jgi:NAD(P)-dependent dehydrogenase (short-subunit alcohol dehydrogenase family)
MSNCRVLVLGGYGNFGSYISRRLAADPNIQLLVAGRSQAAAERFAAGLAAAHPPEALAIDIDGDLAAALAGARPDIVIHTVGPFQRRDYRVAEACIAARAHYLDLADARAFVAGIGALDARAKEAGVAVISGASSVPCLSAAIVDHYRPLFAPLESLDYGISATQQIHRGLATAAAILSYVGKPFRTLRGGEWVIVHGWQDLRRETYPELGPRLFADCDIPDLELFPERYPELRSIRFGAGHELAALNLGTWGLGWLVRRGLIPSLDRWSPFLLRAARLLDRFGSGRSGLHMLLAGLGHDGRAKQVRFFLVARSGHGPNIPALPAVLLAQRLACGHAIEPGARPCLDLLDLDQMRAALEGLDVSIRVEVDDSNRFGCD